MPNRSKEEQAQWEERKDAILELYVEQGLPLHEVVDLMTLQGFTRTKPQYHRTLKTIWRIPKNVREEEWDFIFSRLDERKRPTNVTVRGIVISQKKMRKEKIRRREKTFDRCVSQIRPTPRPRTPPGIRISTPPPISENTDSQLSEKLEHSTSTCEEAPAASDIQDQRTLLCEDDTVMSQVHTDESATIAIETFRGHHADRVSRATGALSSLADLLSNQALFPFSGRLHDYICDFVSENPDGVFNEIPMPERQHLIDENQESIEDLLSHAYLRLVEALIQYKIPSEKLRGIMRDTQDIYNLDLLYLLLFYNSHNDLRRFREDLLFDAVGDVNLPLLHILLDAGVDVNAENTTKTSNVLQWAIYNRHESIVDVLISCGATIFTSNSPESDLAFLSNAITRDAMDLVRPSLATATTSGSQTAQRGAKVLILAVEESRDNIVDVLLEAGFNPYHNIPEATEQRLSSELRLITGFEYCTSAFLAGLDTTATISLKKFLEYPLDKIGNAEQRLLRLRQLSIGYVFALCTGDPDELKNAILRAGLVPNQIVRIMGFDYVQIRLNRAFGHAAASDDYEGVERLINAGAAPNALYRDTYLSIPSSKTPLRWAIERENMSMVRKLIAIGADFNSPTIAHKYPTVLRAAVALKNTEMVRLLVEAGANVNTPPAIYGKTAIEIAAQVGNLGMVTYLLEAGVDICGPHNRHYRRAVYEAQKEGHVSVISLLNEWKRKNYGEQDCDTVDNIVSSMTSEELVFASKEARLNHLKEGTREHEDSQKEHCNLGMEGFLAHSTDDE